MEFLEQFEWPGWIETRHVATAVRVFLLVVVGSLLIRLAAAATRRSIGKRLSIQSAMLLAKAISYGGFALLAIMVLREFGFKLTALLGAAGIAGVAVGFASQTSLGNLISGLFLVWERPFQIGDVVNVGDVTGLAESIDLLSVKIRTFDNRYVRIPNETIIKGQVTNITRYPIRRMDIDVGVAYKEDPARVMEVLVDIANRNPHCLDEPPPLVLLKGFGESSIDILLGAWFEKTDFIQVRNSLVDEIKKRFDEEGIEIPFPHRTLYTGAVSAPFPVRVVSGAEAAPEAAAARGDSPHG